MIYEKVSLKMTTQLQLFEKTELTPPENDGFLGDAIEEFLLIKRPALQQKSLKTYTESLTELIKYFRSDREVKTITKTELLYFFGSIERKPSGVYMVWQTAGFFFKWYFSPDPYNNPMQEIHMKRPKRDPIKGIDKDQVEKILKKITGATSARDKALIAVLFASALRDAEFCGLQLQDVNQRTGQINVRGENAKGRKFRQVYITGRPLLLLNRWIKKAPNQDPDANIWQTRSGSALTEAGVRDIVSRCCKLAGLEDFSFHDFRRGSALAMKRNGADIKDISRFLGHADLKTTERYLALDDTDNAFTAAKFAALK
jgi:site-specific recombinase XerD